MIFFLMQAGIIGMWLIKAGGGRQDGMTVNQPSQGCVVPAVMPRSTLYHDPQADFYLGLPGGSLVLSHSLCQSVSRAQIQPRASVECHPFFFSLSFPVSTSVKRPKGNLKFLTKPEGFLLSYFCCCFLWAQSHVWLICADIQPVFYNKSVDLLSPPPPVASGASVC